MIQTKRTLLSAAAIALCLTPIAHASPEYFPHAKFVPLDAQENHEFGYCLEIQSNIALVGAGIGGDELNSRIGAVYILDVSDIFNPRQLARIDSDTQQIHDWFGNSIACKDNIAAISAPHRSDPNAGGVVYLYDISDPTDPVLITSFTASDTGPDDAFGSTIALDADRLIVGSPKTNLPTTGPGAAYIFDIADPANPVQLEKITPTGSSAVREFGLAVDLQGNLAAVGSWREESAGAAHLYELDQDNRASLQATVYPRDARLNDYFGFQVQLHDQRLFVSSHGSDGPGGLLDQGAGALYIFDIADPASPTELVKLFPNDPDDFDRFSRSFDVHENTLLVGSPNVGTGQGGIFDRNQGACYIFDITDPTSPTQTAKFYAQDGNNYANLGWTSAINSNLAISGAHFDSATIYQAGAVYLFDNNHPESCYADLDRSGTLNYFDISYFINNTVDYNGDESFDIKDLNQFLDEFIAGCIQP